MKVKSSVHQRKLPVDEEAVNIMREVVPDSPSQMTDI